MKHHLNWMRASLVIIPPLLIMLAMYTSSATSTEPISHYGKVADKVIESITILLRGPESTEIASARSSAGRDDAKGSGDAEELSADEGTVPE